MAAESKAAQGQTFNVIDDERPTQRRFASLIRRHFDPRPAILPVPLWVMRIVSGLAWQTNKRIFGGRAKIPGLFVPGRLMARCRPLRFTNQKIKNGLGWKPKYSLREALERSTGTARSDAPRRVIGSTAARAEVSVS